MTALRDRLLALDAGNPVAAALGGATATSAVSVEVVLGDAPGAVEIAATLTGPGAADARVLDLEIRLGDLVLHTMRGGRLEVQFPPDAFRPVRRTILPGPPNPWPERLAAIEFGSLDGRSSDGDLPFFLLSEDAGACGIFVAVGWSGMWRARLSKRQGQASHHLAIITTGCGVELAAGERLELPHVYIGPFRGDGWAAVRRFLHARLPEVHEPRVVYNSFFNENFGIDESKLAANLEVARDIGAEVFTVDAGWYADAGGDDDWHTAGIGTWAEDPAKFPSGLAAFGQRVREQGLVFGLWFDPERAHVDSAVGKAHPDWILRRGTDGMGLLWLGRAEARRWILGVMSAAIHRYGLGWLKWDFNFDRPLAFWQGDERLELEHIRGVYRLAEELLQRHPDLRLEMCAGGGNRLDCEILARCHAYWTSDQTMNPDIVRETLANGLAVFPAQLLYLSLSPNLPAPSEDYPDAWFAGVLTGNFGLMDRLREWSPAVRRRARRWVRTYKSVRHLLDGEVVRFRAETAVPLGDWDAWEVSDPATEEAVLFAFRQNSPAAIRTFRGRHTWRVRLPPGGAAVRHRAP